MMRPMMLAAAFIWAGATAAATPSERLTALSDRYSAHVLARDLTAQLIAGKPVTAIASHSHADLEAEVAFANGLTRELAGIDVAGLTDEERLTVATLRWQLADTCTALLGYDYTFPGPYGLYDLSAIATALDGNPLATDADRAAYLSLVASVAPNLDAIRERLGAQVAKGIYMPRAQVPRTIKALAALRDQISAYNKPKKPVPSDFGASITASNATNLTSIDALIAALGPEYLAKASDKLGLAQYQGGRAFYRQLVKSYTTTDLTPQQLSALGRAGLAADARELAVLAAKLKVGGGHEGLKRFITSDPGYFVKTPEELAARYLRCMARITPLLPAYFDPLPKAPYHVVRLDPALEAGVTYGNYEPPAPGRPEGEYRFNGSNLDKRPQVNACAILFHELMPGHHMQIATQIENMALPAFRRTTAIGAYQEGWAEYASNLAREMGGYVDPRDFLGRLVLNAQINSRLVVDVGLNFDGWTQAQARQFLRENTFMSDPEIDSELFRYGADIPGQALSYGAGYNAIAAMRRDAEKAAGKSFDIRRFHREVIGHGTLPMAVLRAHLLQVMAAK